MLEPNSLALPHMSSGAASYEQKDWQTARHAFESALAVQPDLTPAKFNLAVIAREQEENDRAETFFHEVIASGEILAESYNNLGILAVRREQLDDAIGHFRHAIELRYEFPLAHFNLGTLLLRMEQWEEGWREYEWRWQTPDFVPVQCPQPIWNGQPFDGTLLLHTEQGIGDVFQFAAFIPLIRERCKRVIFLRPEYLDCMFPVEKWADEVRSPGEIRLEAFHAVLPLMSAPHALQVDMNSLPIGEQYLTPSNRSVELPADQHKRKLKVGITWGGSPTHVNDHFRSTSLRNFAPLFQVPGVEFFSLQLGSRTKELQALNAESEFLIHDLSSEQSDFADTAAIVRQLDLVITVDTSLIHLVGGMGLPGWALLSRRSDWRWGLEKANTNWYPSIRLFRQRTLNDWNELMLRVAAELQDLVTSLS